MAFLVQVMAGFFFKTWQSLVAAGLGLILSGCSLIYPDATAPARPPSSPSKAVPPPSVPPSSPVTAKPIRPSSPPSPPPSPTAKSDPAELVGLSESDLHHLLGDPRDEHREGAARVQTYAGDGCTLDVVLFLDVSRSEWSVLSYDLTATATSGKRTPETCYGQMRGKR